MRNVLDLGCGAAKFMPFFEKRRVTYLGIDFSENAINLIAPSRLQNISLAYAEKLPFRDSSIDCIFAHHVVEHILEPAVLISELKRVLQPAGYVAIVTTVIPFGSLSCGEKSGFIGERTT